MAMADLSTSFENREGLFCVTSSRCRPGWSQGQHQGLKRDFCPSGPSYIGGTFTDVVLETADSAHALKS